MSALDRLFRFARRAEFDGAHRVASAAVWEDWSKRAGEKGNRKSLGTVAAEGKRLVFEATSRRRAENGRTPTSSYRCYVFARQAGGPPEGDGEHV